MWRWHLWEQQLLRRKHPDCSTIRMQRFRECLGDFGQPAGSPHPAEVPLLQEHKPQIICDISTVQRKL